MPNPGSNGGYAGFYYSVDPPAAPVVVDVAMGGSLNRYPITGVGSLIPEGHAGDTEVTTCDTTWHSRRIDLSNGGTIPAWVRVGWGWGGDPAQCGVFDVQLVSGGSVLFAGSLCDLPGNPALVSLNPGVSYPLDVAVALHSGVVPTASVTVPLLFQVTWWQFNSAAPGYGWWGETQGPFPVEVIWQQTTRSVGGDSGTGISGFTLPDEGSDSTSTGTTTAKPVLPTTTTTTVAPPPEETTTTTVAPPAEETTTTTVAPPPEETTTTTESPAGGTLTLSGRVWEDLDGDGVTVVGHPQQEPGVAGVEVVLRAEDGTRLATAWTGAEGVYQFDALDQGRFLVEFRAPEGFGFRDPGVASADAQELADVLDVAVEEVVVDDLDLAPVPAEGEKARAKTAVFDFDEATPGDGDGHDGVADAAMVRLPEEAPEEGEGTAPGGNELPPAADEPPPDDLPGATVDPNTQASRPEQPTVQTVVVVGSGSGDGGKDGAAGGDDGLPPDGPPGEGGVAGEGEGAQP